MLERIAEHGSIAAAGRSLSMSYRRVWELVSDMNTAFREPLVIPRMGGQKGGGATLTPLGHAIVQEYRAMERKSGRARRSLNGLEDGGPAGPSGGAPRW